MGNIIYILINFGYIIVFCILSLSLFLITLPEKINGLESYIRSRRILGTATSLMALFCLLRIILPQNSEMYLDFWILVTFTLIFSWLSYGSFLHLIETPRYVRKNFMIDGLYPVMIMSITGAVGLLFPQTQKVMIFIFGGLYLVKCSRMFYICVKEYRICKKELENWYGDYSDIGWMYILLVLSFILSISTVCAFYIKMIQVAYYIAIPVIYSFMVFKVINFAPKKITTIRNRTTYLESKSLNEKKEKTKDLSEKIGPLVEQWVNEKKFCKEGLTIKDVASEIGTNHNYLSQYINNSMEMTFQTWLNTLMIEESKILLASNEKMSIEEVGIKVGIPQNYNFSRWFKQITDMTPFQYRRTCLSGQ